MAEDEIPDEETTEDLDGDFEDEPEEIGDALVVDDDETFETFETAEEEVVVEEPAPVATATKAKPPASRARKGDEEDEEEDDDEVDPDDVEADLDTILKDRIAAQPDEDEDEEQPEPDERGDGSGRIQPKRPGEFVCQSCFLVKHPSQLADADLLLCADCV